MLGQEPTILKILRVTLCNLHKRTPYCISKSSKCALYNHRFSSHLNKLLVAQTLSNELERPAKVRFWKVEKVAHFLKTSKDIHVIRFIFSLKYKEMHQVKP